MLRALQQQLRRRIITLPSQTRRLLAMRHTVRRNWQEDPVTFLLNVQRRRGNRLSTGLLEKLNGQGSWFPSQRALALAALLSGDRVTLTERLQEQIDHGVPSRFAKNFADIALAGDLPDLAAQLANSMPMGEEGEAITRARLLWYAGDMQAALELLAGVGERAERLRERYRAEADVFGDWVPRLAPVSGYEPGHRVVLHFLTNSLPYTESGYAQRTHSLLREQVAAGWEVHAATRLGYPQNIGSVGASRQDVIDGIQYHRLPAIGSQGNLRERQQQEAEALLELVLHLRPSILHTTTHFVNGLTTRSVAHAVGTPWVYEVRGQLADTWASKRGPAALKSGRYLAFQRREAEVAQSADGVITLGDEMHQVLVQSGIEAARISLAPNGVGEDFLNAPLPPNQARAVLGLPRDRIHIGTVSSLVPYEGLEVLVDAFALLAAVNDNVELLIVGDGESAGDLRRRVAAAGLDPARVLPGRVPRREASMYHQALDIFVVPRLDREVTRSVTPLKPVEAMASSRPVVASDLPALREIVVDGETGLLVPVENPVALFKALERLAADEVERARMGSCGRRSALNNRTWKRSIQASLDHYSRTIERQGERR